MTARAFFFTRIRDEASGAAYERWAAEVDYPFTRPQPSVGRYEIMRVDPAVVGDGSARWAYLELIEVLDADLFPSVFEQPEAKPIIDELRTFIAPDPLGLVGRQVVMAGDREELRSSVRAAVAVRLVAGQERGAYEAHVAGAVDALAAEPGVERVEVVAITGRYKREEPAPFEYLVVVDLPPGARGSGTLSWDVAALLPSDLTDPQASFALVGTLIEELARS